MCNDALRGFGVLGFWGFGSYQDQNNAIFEKKTLKCQKII